MADVDERMVRLLADWREDPVRFVSEAFRSGRPKVDAENPPPTPEIWQAEALQALVDHDKIAIKSGHGVGKALHVDTKVLTPSGWRMMRELRPGDMVFGSDGAPTEVLGVYPQGERDLFRVTFDDEVQILADAEHLWATQTAHERKEILPARVRTTQQIAETIDNHHADEIFFKHMRETRKKRGRGQKSYHQRRRLNHSLPTIRPIRHEAVETDVDPYEAGWNKDKEAMGWLRFGSIDQRAKCLRGFVDNPEHVVEPERNPGPYLFSSRGMMVTKDRKGTADASCWPELMDIARSLGCWVRRGAGRLRVYPAPLVPISSRPMAGSYQIPRPNMVHRVEYAGPGPAICIKVAAEDGLFVVDGYKLTHNTTFLSWAILWFALTHQPYKMPCTAPAGATLTSALWPEIGKWHRRLNPALHGMLNLTSSRLELVGSKGGSFAEARTSRVDQPEALQGFHEINLMFVIDEASGVPDIVFQVGEGSLSTPGAKVLMTGNPTRVTGYFWDAFNPRPGQRQRWKTMTVSSYDSTRVSREWLEDMKAKYGEHSPIYRIRVLGEFPETDDFALIPRHVVEAAVARSKLVEPVWGPIVWGVDVARQGNDRTTVAKRMGAHLLEPIEAWNGFDLMQSSGKIMRMFDDTVPEQQPKEILIDVIGVGAGLYDRLKEQGLPVTAVNVAERAEERDRYYNRRSELWFRAKDWLSEPTTTLLEDPELEAELVTPHYSILSNGKERVEPKEDTKKRLGENGRSPDLADALVLTFAASSRWTRKGLAAGLQDGILPPQTDHGYDPRRW